MTGIAVKNEGMFDQYEDDDMLMVMSLAEYWEIMNRLKRLDDRMTEMRKFQSSLVKRVTYLTLDLDGEEE